ncbi:hypothetical protein ACIBI9_20450 [Nonomuraea sp. NPDC050451]|uniref:hypothetical protein n=1 Tax=Nonomuraea sp. NPDC050451 TaxID=3364364 RepID=UPI0037ABF506
MRRTLDRWVAGLAPLPGILTRRRRRGGQLLARPVSFRGVLFALAVRLGAGLAGRRCATLEQQPNGQ